MANMDNQRDVCDVEDLLEVLQRENERLRRDNERLQKQAEDVASANAHAAELMAQIEETHSVTESGAMLASLQAENKKLQEQAEGVAAANAHAAELMVQLEELNDTLKHEIRNREQVEEELRQANKEMDNRVKERTTELTALNEQMKNEISERKRAQEALSESEGRLRTILDNIQTGIIIIDPETHTIVDANPVATRLIGAQKSELIGSTCHKYICPAEVGRCPITDLEQIVDNSERVLLTAAGEEQPIIKTVTSVMLGGRKHLLESFVDITQLRHTEKELEKLNKDLKQTVLELSRSNRQLNEFVHIAAHDLKTPLRGIGTLAEWLATDFADKFDENGQGQIKLLVERVKRIDTLLDGMLRCSGITRTGKNENAINLNTLLNTIIKEIEPPDNITITIEKELPSIIGTEGHFKKIFQNLIVNAIEHNDKLEGKIKIGFTKEEETWKFSVSDNGQGIEQRHFERIFRIFQTLPSGNGHLTTGIGLTETRKIIELYGGRIWVESKVGKGSVFYFTLPK